MIIKMKIKLAIILILLIVLVFTLADPQPDSSNIVVETVATSYIRLKDGYHLEFDYYIASDESEWGRAILAKDSPPTLTEKVKENFWTTLLGSSGIVTILTATIITIINKKLKGR